MQPNMIGPAMAVFGAAALAAAFVAQYGFDLQPCILCLYQRVPYAVVMILGGAAYFAPRAVARGLVALIGLAFIVGAGIAAFHVGVEQHWWQGTAACTGDKLDTSSLEALRAQIMSTKVAQCDKVAWSLFGISMAGYNVAASLGMGLIAFVSLYITRKN